MPVSVKLRTVAGAVHELEVAQPTADVRGHANMPMLHTRLSVAAVPQQTWAVQTSTCS